MQIHLGESSSWVGGQVEGYSQRIEIWEKCARLFNLIEIRSKFTATASELKALENEQVRNVTTSERSNMAKKERKEGRKGAKTSDWQVKRTV